MDRSSLDRALGFTRVLRNGARMLIVIGATALSANADTHIVDASGMMGHRYIQDAIDVARSGDVILVRPGSYRPKGAAAAVATIPVHLTDLTIQSTSGPGSTTIGATRSLWRPFSRGVRWNGDRGRLIGFTIRDGEENLGGGLYVGGDALAVESCEFISNHAHTRGGAVYLASSSVDPSLRTRFLDCDFSLNTTDGDGGAMYVVGGVELTSCELRFSDAGDRGGALCIAGNGADSILEDVSAGWCEARLGGILAITGGTTSWNGGSALFSDASQGAAVYAEDGSLFEASEWYAVGNEATRFGGAVSLEYAEAEFEDSLFAYNESGFAGGGIDAWYASFVSSNTAWYRNESIREGGGIALFEADAEVHTDAFEGNGSAEGGALWADRAAFAAIGAEFLSNDADFGGGLWAEDSTIEVRDGDFSSNTGNDAGGAMHCTNTHAEVDSTRFAANGGTLGGGLYARSGSSALSWFVDCVFEGNDAMEGGAVWADNFVEFERTIFLSNEAFTGAQVYLTDSGAGSGSAFDGCSFEDGSLLDPAGEGGAIYASIGSGTLALYDCDAVLNDSGTGGGAFRLLSDPGTAGIEISSCRFEENREERDGGGFFMGDGGQIHGAGGLVTIADSYIGGTAGWGGAVYGLFDIRRSTLDGAAGGGAGAAWLLSSSTVTSSVLIGTTDGALGVVHATSGGLEDCIVVSTRTENTAMSPGHAATTVGAEVLDAIDCVFIAGADDIATISGIDSGNRLGTSEAYRADFDRDGDVDEDDSSHVLAMIGTTGWGLAEDLDDDGDVDLDDHDAVVALEGSSCP